MKDKKNSRMSNRAFKAGVLLAKGLIEMINLMYQRNTAINFLEGLMHELENEHYARTHRHK